MAVAAALLQPPAPCRNRLAPARIGWLDVRCPDGAAGAAKERATRGLTGGVPETAATRPATTSTARAAMAGARAVIERISRLPSSGPVPFNQRASPPQATLRTAR